MKHVMGWDEEEDDYTLCTSQFHKKKPKKAFKGCCGYCGEFGHKAVDCPNKESTQNEGSKGKDEHKKKHSTKGDHKEKVIGICQKSSVLIVVNMDILHEIVQKHMMMLICSRK